MEPIQSIEIIDFTDKDAIAIKELNYEWLQKYFRVENHDVVVLSNPKAEIIDKGGFIFYAKLEDKIIGTASLLKVNDAVLNLVKWQ